MSVEREPWRVVTDDEVPKLIELGQRLRYWRLQAGITQAALADALAMHRVHMSRIERGRRRTRQSTLTHIAIALVEAGRRSGHPLDAVEILTDLLDAGGEAIAPESNRSEWSVQRKRKRRVRENLKHDTAMILELVGATDELPVQGGPELFLRRRANDAYHRLASGLDSST